MPVPMTLPSAFSPDAARALAGPDWLRDRRAAAAEQVADTAWPSAEDELWRYSRVGQLDLAVYAPGAATTTVDDASGLIGGPESDSWATIMDHPLDVFAGLNDAFSAAPIVIRVPRGRVVTDPIVITHQLTAGVASFPRLIIEAGENSEIIVVERFIGGSGGLVCPVLELHAGTAARVKYQSVNTVDRDAWLIASQVARSERDSTTILATVALGGSYARVRTDARLLGQGAHGEQIGVSFGEGDQMLDLRVTQTHAAPRTTSDLLFKSAVQDSARSVYTGLIHIKPDARGARAFQTNRNLKLSPDAWADSVPNLDIENNDVKCSHASTVGPIDPDQRFYLESRGVPAEIADRLIVLGFFDDVIDKLPASVLNAALRREVADKLDRRTTPSAL
jgi:Fe-S cluster assembly protein SufD